MTDMIRALIAMSLVTAFAVGCDKDKPAEANAEAPAADAQNQGAAIQADKPAEAAPAQKAQIGKPAPDFTLTDEAGTEHKLSQYKGKIVVLEWTNPGCPYVVRHYDKKTMATTFEKSGSDDVVWLTVDSTKSVTADEAKKWKEKEGFPYPVLLDASGATGKVYGAKTTPHMYVIDKDGNLQYNGAIDDDPKGSNENPRNYVHEAIQALKDGKNPEVPATDPYGCSVKYAS
jgi:peroxiredoxin